MDHRAGRKRRVTRRKDISRLFEQGRKMSDRLMTLYGLPNDQSAALTRAGVAVSRRHGDAVRRNRVKRLCREAFRLTRGQLPAGWDFMILPRAGRPLQLAELQESLRALAGRLARDQGQPRSQP